MRIKFLRNFHKLCQYSSTRERSNPFLFPPKQFHQDTRLSIQLKIHEEEEEEEETGEDKGQSQWRFENK